MVVNTKSLFWWCLKKHPAVSRTVFRTLPSFLTSRKPNRWLHSTFFQRFVGLRLGIRGTGPEHRFLPQFSLIVLSTP
jgi:hypothetical protein